MDAHSDLDAKGFLRSLYDFGFTSLVTTKIIKFVYILIVITFSLGATILILSSFASGKPVAIFFGLILVPLGYVIYLTMARIWMEILIVVFRMGEDVRSIRNRASGLAQGGALPGGVQSPWRTDQGEVR